MIYWINMLLSGQKIFNEVQISVDVAYWEVTDPISQENFERLWKLNPETAATEYELFRKMNESEDFKKEMLKSAMALQHGTASQLYGLSLDFTQYYPETKEAHRASVSL